MQKEAHAHSVLPRGLTGQEAAVRLRQYGPNELPKSARSAVLDFFARFKNPLLIVLLAAAAISGFFKDALSASLIVVIVFISGVLDFFNTYRAEKAAEALRAKVKITTAVIRSGALEEIPLAHVVPGDVIKLAPGDIVPADGRMIVADDFFINESSLTGESFPVERSTDARVYMGSSVVTGNGYMEVETTGAKTAFGDIAKRVAGKAPPTQFDRGIRDFSVLIMRTTFALVLFVFFVNTLIKHQALESFLFAAALAVGITPELLPMIIALNLTKGSLAMSKRGVIVKKLSAIQNCGSMDVLCTDKTGTLTEDHITLVKYVDADGNESVDVLRWAYLNGVFRTALQSPLDVAIREFKEIDIGGFRKTEEVPFDFIRRRDSIAVERQGTHTLITKGAPESVFAVCTHYGTDEGMFAEGVRQRAEEEYRRLSDEGFRVLAVATKKIHQPRDVYTPDDESGMAFRGFVAFLDPPKKTAAKAARLIKERGIEIKILTGDNERVTKKVARDIGLDIKGVLTGDEMETLTDGSLREAVEGTTLFARVTPEQKRRIIILLQEAGHGVGYLGDGINDAPSLVAADVGFSVNNAVDVAKESADLILLHKSLQALLDGISEGRKTFANTLKYLKMSLSSNFGNMFSMAGASLLLPFFPMLPAQILLNNLLYDSSQMTIPLDAVDEEQVRAPRSFDVRYIKKFMLVFGPLSSVFDFLTFAVLVFVFHAAGGAFQTGWFLESIATQTFVVYALRTRRFPFFKSRPSLPLVVSTISAVVIGWVVALSFLGSVFKLTLLPVPLLLAIIAIVVAYVFTIDVAKRLFANVYQD